MRKRERLTSPNDTPATNAKTAFERLYYNIENLSFNEYKKYIELLKKRRANLSSDDYKKSLGDFLAASELLFPDELSMRRVVAFMKKEGQLPFDDSEARRRNEENLRRIREERERERRERERKEQEEQERRERERKERERRERERKEQERRRQQEEDERQSYQLDDLLDVLSERRTKYVVEQLKIKAAKKKRRRRWGIVAAIVLVLVGFFLLQSEGNIFQSFRNESKQLEEKQKEVSDRLLSSEWKRIDEKATIDFLSVDSNQVVAELIQNQKYNKTGKPMQHTLKGIINPTCDTLFLTDVDKNRWVDLSLYLVLSNSESLYGEYTHYNEGCCQFVTISSK